MPEDPVAVNRPAAQTDSETPGDDPFVTVIMPIRNEEEFIERSLGAVLAQDYPADRYETLIADGMSTDSTRDVVRSVAGDRNVTILDNPGRIAPTALNVGIAHASGEIIVRVASASSLAVTLCLISSMRAARFRRSLTAACA